MRRVIVIVLTASVVGIVAWSGLRSRPTNASGLARHACATFGGAFRERGPRVRDELRTASVQANPAAVKSASYRKFAAAALRLAGPAPAKGVGTDAVTTDLATVRETCGGQTLPANVAIATRVPYLTDATSHSVLVNFATDRPVEAPTVFYGRAGSSCRTAQAVAAQPARAITVGTRTDYLVSVKLGGLSAATRYCYQLGPSALDLSTQETPGEFVTAFAPRDPRPFSFAVIGDWGGGTPDEARVLSQIASSPASFIVTVGDNAYIGGTQGDYGDLTAGNVFGPQFWPKVGTSRPTFVAQGNHGFSNFRAALANWPEPSVVRASGGRYRRDDYCCIPTLARARTYASAWYAFDWGPARFYILDAAWADRTGNYRGDFFAHWNGSVPGCPVCGTELRWLEADLAAHAATPLKFAFFHYPLHVDASDHLSDTMLGGLGKLEGLLASNGVDIVFNGHSHLYERNLPQIPGSPMLSYVTGGGGVNNGTDTLAGVRGCSAFDAYAVGTNHTSCHAPHPQNNGAVYHYLLVTVQHRQVTVTPTDETGRTFDVHTWTF